MIFFEINCFKFPCVAGAPFPKPHAPSGKKSVPAKGQFEDFTLSNSSVVDFYPLTRDFN